jgi:hypothetical protein
MGKLISDISSRDEHLKAIGLITVNFALLENQIAFAIWFLIGLDQQTGQIITAELSLKGLVALFCSLYRNKTNDPSAINELNDLMKKVTQAEEKRNVIMHSVWAAGDTEKTITRFKQTAKTKKGLQNQFEQMTVEKLNEIANEIAEAAAEVNEFVISKIATNLPKNDL